MQQEKADPLGLTWEATWKYLVASDLSTIHTEKYNTTFRVENPSFYLLDGTPVTTKIIRELPSPRLMLNTSPLAILQELRKSEIKSDSSGEYSGPPSLADGMRCENATISAARTGLGKRDFLLLNLHQPDDNRDIGAVFMKKKGVCTWQGYSSTFISMSSVTVAFASILALNTGNHSWLVHLGYHQVTRVMTRSSWNFGRHIRIGLLLKGQTKASVPSVEGVAAVSPNKQESLGIQAN